MDIKTGVLAIGRNARLLTKDGWIAEVQITDATVAYGQVRLGIKQDFDNCSRPEQYVDASRVEII